MITNLTLYHGSTEKSINPTYGLGDDRHDYGRGFYLTESIELAKEWAVCTPDNTSGWVHRYMLKTDTLTILDFTGYPVLSWLAELMKHRPADNSRRYRLLSEKFIAKYGLQSDGYDVIRGWRANASYFYIAKSFVRDEIDISILEELLMLGELGIQFCLRSEKAFRCLTEDTDSLLLVDYDTYNPRYNARDARARSAMRELIDSDKNPLETVFSTLIKEN